MTDEDLLLPRGASNADRQHNEDHQENWSERRDSNPQHKIQKSRKIRHLENLLKRAIHK